MDQELIVSALKEYGLSGFFIGFFVVYMPRIGKWIGSELLTRWDAHAKEQAGERHKFIEVLEAINRQSMQIASDNQVSLMQIAHTLEAHTHTLDKISELVTRCPDRLKK